jgi:hypothetical protein
MTYDGTRFRALALVRKHLFPKLFPQFFSTFDNVPTFSGNRLNQTSRARFKSLPSNPRYSGSWKQFTC